MGICEFSSCPEQIAETCIGVRPQEAPDEVQEIWEETGARKGEVILDARGAGAAGQSDDVVCDSAVCYRRHRRRRTRRWR